jgi:zinc protease
MNRQILHRAALAAALLAPALGCKSTKAVAKPVLASTPDAAFRKTRPQPSGELRFTPPAAESFKLKNGLVVYTVERHDLPLVAVELVVKSGRDTDPADRQGLAGFAAAMLDEGTKGKGAPQIAASFEDLAVHYHAEAGYGASFVGFNTLAPSLEQALDVFSDVVLHPAFADKDLERVRGERLASLTASHDDPAEVARDVLMRALYGEKSAWGAPTAGSPEGLKAIKKADLQKFHDAYYVPSNAALVVVGDVKAADLKPMLEKRLATWKDKKVKPTKPPEPKATTRGVLLVDKPGAPQSQIWLGQTTFAAKDPDREAFTLLNDIFGGLFSSRVNLDLREGKGWSYGVFSTARWVRGKSPWIVAGGFVADKTPDSVAELVKLVETLHQGDVTGEELAAARDAEIRSLAGLFESDDSTSRALAALIGEELPIDYYSGVQSKFEALTAADLKRVAQSHLDPAKMTIVVVGPKAEQQAKVEALGLGKLELRDDMGHAVK